MYETRNNKDTVFIDLFCDDEVEGKQNFLSLYNSIHGTNLTLENTKLEKFKLDKVMYQKSINDISMLVNDKLIVLLEHQSTLNYNLPLRILMYVARLYERLVPTTQRYRKKAVPIPKPEFYVFYNGTEKIPEDLTLKLSDSFIEKADDSYFSLDLFVKVVNINIDSENPIFKNCEKLNEYTKLMEFVKEERNCNSENALEIALTRAIQQGILTEYLERKGSEVRNMLMVDYNYEDDIACQRMEAREEGLAEGAQQKALDAARKLIAKGMDLEAISEVTDLTLETVQELAKEINS